MTDAQTEARAIVSAALPPHEQAMLGGDAIVVLADLIATALAAERAALAEARRERDEARKALEQRDTDITEFMGRLGSRWFLEQGWFPESVGAREDDARRAARRVREGGNADD